MFTVKLFRNGPSAQVHIGAPDTILPKTSKILSAGSVEVDSSAPGTKHITLNPGQQNEHHEYVVGADATTGSSSDWDWAVIENAAGKTTEVVRP